MHARIFCPMIRHLLALKIQQKLFIYKKQYYLVIRSLDVYFVI